MQNHQQVNLSPAVAAVIGNFAKANKISKAKLSALAAEITAIPQEKVRKISSESATIRAAIVEIGDDFTTADIVEKTGITDKVKINNNIRSLALEGIVKDTGEVRKVSDARPSKVWAVVK